jgi:hypothetical protein
VSLPLFLFIEGSVPIRRKQSQRSHFPFLSNVPPISTYPIAHFLFDWIAKSLLLTLSWRRPDLAGLGRHH